MASEYPQASSPAASVSSTGEMSPTENEGASIQVCNPARLNIAHPYARLYAKKEGGKRRKIWNHTLEKSLFNPFEL